MDGLCRRFPHRPRQPAPVTSSVAYVLAIEPRGWTRSEESQEDVVPPSVILTSEGSKVRARADPLSLSGEETAPRAVHMHGVSVPHFVG